MRYNKIFGFILYDNLIRNMILFICGSVFAFNMCGILYDTVTYRETLKITNSHELDSVLYMVFEADDVTLSEFEDKIDGLSYVDRIRYLNNKTADDIEHEKSFEIALWGEGLSKGQSLKMRKGRMPASPNEIVLSDAFSSDYGLDQKVTLSVTTFADINDFDSYTRDETVVSIVGFYSLESVLPNAGSFVQYLDATSADLFLPQYSGGPAYVCELRDEGGNEIEFTYKVNDLNGTELVRIKGNDLPDVIKGKLKDDLSAYNVRIYTFDELRGNYQNDSKNLFMRVSSKAAVALCVILISMFSYVCLSLLQKYREMTVYYLYGMTWTGIILMNTASLLPGVLAGNILGYLISYSERSSYGYYHPEYLLIIWLISLFLIFLFITPMFVYYSWNNPIENIAREAQ